MLFKRRRTVAGSTAHRKLLKAQSYIGSRNREYTVRVPAASSKDDELPLVMVIHGCRQDNQAIENISGFSELAAKHGFRVVYPFVTSYLGVRDTNCWGWWVDSEVRRGAGEVEDLWQIIQAVKAEFAVNEKRIHVVGLSAGGGMAVALGVAQHQNLASIAVVAGVPYGEDAESVHYMPNMTTRHKRAQEIADAMLEQIGTPTRTLPAQIVHSLDDKKVEIQSACNIRDSWGLCFGVDTQSPVTRQNGKNKGIEWQHSTYGNGSDASVETLFLRGVGHGWYGGKPGQFSFPDAPDVASWNWEFFRSNPLM
ncbi:MAG: PHB depolymerase family esterase [Pseudomonadota bacterium]